METKTFDDLENRFSYHSPKEGQAERYTAIRAKAKELAYLIRLETPSNTHEQATALTKLDECVMWANAAIARNE
jgi:hypothetical protein